MYLQLQVWRDFPLSMINLLNAASLHLRPFHPTEELPGNVEDLSNKKNISEANCECNKHNLSTSKTGLGEGGQTRTGAFQDRYPRPRCLASDNHSGKLRSMNFYTTKKTHLQRATNFLLRFATFWLEPKSSTKYIFQAKWGDFFSFSSNFSSSSRSKITLTTQQFQVYIQPYLVARPLPVGKSSSTLLI